MTAFTPNKAKISTVRGSPVNPRSDFSKFDNEFKNVYSTKSMSSTDIY